MTQKKKHIFNISYKSDVDDCVYQGTFCCKKLSVGDLMKVPVLKTRLNGGYHHDPEQPGVGVDASTDGMNYMLAHLELSLVDKPDWWDLTQIGDLGLVTAVFSEVAEFENSFRRKGQNSASDSEGGGSKTGKDSNTPGTVEKVVGEEIPASLEP